MLMAKISRAINGALRLSGFELRRVVKPTTPRASFRGGLEHIRRLGVRPQTVIDVGAADGTQDLYDTFPDAKHVLFEAMEEFRPALEVLAQQRSGLEFHIAAASREEGQSVLNVHADRYGSSLYLESEGAQVDGVPRTIPTVRIDKICIDCRPPFLIKLDVQGGELDALAGAEGILPMTECILLEAVFFPFFKGGPLFRDVVEWLHARGFVLYDIMDPGYRPLDHALAQVDAGFVPKSSKLLTNTDYATAEQRRLMTESLQKLFTP
jgi:FkbM family methyltransferase